MPKDLSTQSDEPKKGADGPGVGLDIETWDALKGASWPIFLGIAERTRAAGLTAAQSSLLFVLYGARETMTPLAVAHVLKVTAGTVTGTLNPLEDAGLIERLHGRSTDRRVVHLRLTAKGRKVMDRWLQSCRVLIQERMSTLTVSDKRQLIRLLGKIAPSEPGVPEGLASAARLEPFGAAPRQRKKG